jgi:glucokinase
MKKYVLGIDIGGTNTTFGIVSEEGTIECRFRLLSKDYASFEELIKAIQKVLDSNAPKLFDKLVGVGIGAPMIHPITGIIDQAANLQWQQPIAVKAITESIFKLPVATNNDANIAMIGEWKLGKAKGCTNVVMVTLGTGVGGGFIVNNQLVLGHTGMAGEIGHMIYEPFGRSCNCGRLGCYERYVSASGIVTSYQAIKHLYTTSILHQ